MQTPLWSRIFGQEAIDNDVIFTSKVNDALSAFLELVSFEYYKCFPLFLYYLRDNLVHVD